MQVSAVLLFCINSKSIAFLRLFSFSQVLRHAHFTRLIKNLLQDYTAVTQPMALLQVYRLHYKSLIMLIDVLVNIRLKWMDVGQEYLILMQNEAGNI